MDSPLGGMLFALFIAAHALAVIVLNKSKGIVDPPSGANPPGVPPQGVAAAIASRLGHHSQHLGNSGSRPPPSQDGSRSRICARA
jgi:hypothetical protein